MLENPEGLVSVAARVWISPSHLKLQGVLCRSIPTAGRTEFSVDMDIKRPPKSKLKRRIRTSVLIVIGLAAVGGITFGLTKLKPAAPTLDRSTAVIGTLKRGQMLREVRGIGTLVPQLTRWVPAPADGRVEKILIQAGVEVGAS